MFETVIAGYRWFFLQIADLIGLGWGIVALSFLTSLAMTPLMKAVAGIVRRESEYQSVILPQIAAIKERYGSDMERHGHIQRLYSRYSYSPLSAIKKVLPLFVQIPFLMLTYFMLKNTAHLKGVSFFLLRDLGNPDCLLEIFGINLLPFVMTGTNVVAVFATSDFTSRDRFQAICISMLFFALLYTAPSALLLYWSLNNFITLIRTLFDKHGEGAKLLSTRISMLRHLPEKIRESLTLPVLAHVSLFVFVISIYLRLMVLMKVYFFNYMASFWGMNVFMSITVILEYMLSRQDNSRCCRLLAGISAIFALILIAANVVAIVSILISFDLLRVITYNIDIPLIFDTMTLVWTGLVLIRERRRLLNIKSLIKIKKESCVWFLIPFSFSIHYSFASADFKLPLMSVCLLSLYMFVPFLISFFLTRIAYGSYIRADLLLKVIAGVFVGIYVIPMFSVESGKFLGYGSNLILRILIITIFSFLFYKWGEKKIFRVIIPFMLCIVVFNVFLSQLKSSNETDKRVLDAMQSDAQKTFSCVKPIRKNSIYFLVYDGYAHDTILRGLKFKHANISYQLKQRGFVRYDAYSVGSDTVASMGATFAVGNVVQGSNRSMLAGNNAFCDFLRRGNYKTSYVLCGYVMPYHGECAPGDFYFPSPHAITKPEMVLLPCILKGFLSQAPNTFNAYSTEEWIKEKQKVIDSIPADCGFVYSHTPFPGHVPPHPAYWKSPALEYAKYEQGLANADKEILNDVDRILRKRDDSIIIVASDHGSFFSQPREIGLYDAFTMLDRCGVQLLIRWPEDYTPCLDLSCLKNVFLEVMIYLSGDRSLKKFKSDGETLYIQYPLRAPAGSIKNGIIHSGVDCGKKLFKVAEEHAKEQTDYRASNVCQ